MTCEPVKLQGGGRAIVCSRGQRRKRCFACDLLESYQCDWKMGGGKTCDRPLCPDHAKQVGPDKHLCPEHIEAYERWKSEHAEPKP